MELNRDNQGYGSLDAFLTHRRRYEIGPHTDRPMKWVTTLIYLPTNDRRPHLGTAVLRSKTGRTQRKSQRESFADADFEHAVVSNRLRQIVKLAPYFRNSLLAFAPCDQSWHGVPAIESPWPRDTIQGFIQEARKPKEEWAKGACNPT
eukprot:scaffold401_cov399-Prasinococcus_capsulatus_cf.AAC.52